MLLPESGRNGGPNRILTHPPGVRNAQHLNYLGNGAILASFTINRSYCAMETYSSEITS